MNKSIVTSLNTDQKIKTYINNMPQSLIVIGAKYAGKKYLTKYMVDLIEEKNGEKVQFIIIEKEIDKKTIGIDQIRYIKKQLNLKNKSIRIIMFPDAEELTHEAQSSLLKILEEPPQNTHFIFTISNESNLLDTIKSRSVLWNIKLPTVEDIELKLNQKKDPTISKYILMSNRKVGLLNRLMVSSEKPITEVFELAKEILTSSDKNKLKLIKQLDFSYDSSIYLLDALEIISTAALENSIKNNSPTNKIKNWTVILNEIIKSKEEINKKAQAKLVLTKLFLMI